MGSRIGGWDELRLICAAGLHFAANNCDPQQGDAFNAPTGTSAKKATTGPTLASFR